jgi:hypothetical protein
MVAVRFRKFRAVGKIWVIIIDCILGGPQNGQGIHGVS